MLLQRSIIILPINNNMLLSAAYYYIFYYYTNTLNPTTESQIPANVQANTYGIHNKQQERKPEEGAVCIRCASSLVMWHCKPTTCGYVHIVRKITAPQPLQGFLSKRRMKAFKSKRPNARFTKWGISIHWPQHSLLQQLGDEPPISLWTVRGSILDIGFSELRFRWKLRH